ncbi:GNAT family N-acetyltransferase [Chryseolinea sp. T2]|uniref:GNAT family N-acetyltransferase n=1 Tax=Chryseolinea sp. T2 TaxID=3129255 RepID=UPI003077BF2B
MNHVRITRVNTPEQYEEASRLIREYAAWLNFDLAFQNFEAEMSSLPAMYNDADGGLFIAYLDNQPAGVIGLRRLENVEGEIKRMFVKQEARGHGLGSMLLKTCISKAKELQYHSLKLDTTNDMKSAIKLYEDHGFAEIPAYRYNPEKGARYFELHLTG